MRHAAEAATASGADPVLAVLGHRGADVLASLAGLPVRPVPNPAYADGLSTSLRAGFAALPAEAEGAIVLLGDMPLVTPALIDGLIAAWLSGGEPDAVVPTLRGRRGNPVLLSRRLGPLVEALTGDHGAGPLLRDRPGVLEIELDVAAVALDVDTPDALAAAQARTTPSSTAE